MSYIYAPVTPNTPKCNKFFRNPRRTIALQNFIKSFRYLSYGQPVPFLLYDKGAEVVRENNKKDGYRQQNVRQRQKLISIIDYDVCMTFY